MSKTIRTFKPSFVSLFLTGLLLSLSACSIAGFGPEVDDFSTASTIRYDDNLALQETVDPADWEKIRNVMALALVTHPPGEPLPWENEITGTVGTIIASGATSNADGRFCRHFSTTLNGVGGIQQFKGDACRNQNGSIELTGLTPHNAVVDVSSFGKDKKIQ